MPVLGILLTFSRDTFLVKSYGLNQKIKRIKKDTLLLNLGIISTTILFIITTLAGLDGYLIVFGFLFGIVNSEYSQLRYRCKFGKYLETKFIHSLIFLTIYFVAWYLKYTNELVLALFLSYSLVLLRIISFKYLKFLKKNLSFVKQIKQLKESILQTFYGLISPTSSYLESIIIKTLFGLESLGVFGFFYYLLRGYTFAIQGLTRYYSVDLIKIFRSGTSRNNSSIIKLAMLNIALCFGCLILGLIISAQKIYYLLCILTFILNFKNISAYFYFSRNKEGLLLIIIAIFEILTIISIWLFSVSLEALIFIKILIHAISLLTLLLKKHVIQNN